MKLSIIIPVYNEIEIIPILKKELEDALKHFKHTVEIILIDDGSTDHSAELIKNWIKENATISLIELSRNFGHQAAITAGLKESTGDAIVIIDADLQDPPDLIPEMVTLWETGFKIVLAQRKSRGEGFFKQLLFKLFYKVFGLLSDMPPVTTGVFGLMDRVVVNHLLNLGEQNRFIPGLRNWVGFNKTVIEYDRGPRLAGKPKQSLRRLIKYGLDAIFSFSYKPLRLSFLFGMIISSLCFLYAFILIVLRLFNINLVHGFTTMAVAIFFLGGVLLISNGILGEYLGRIYDEVKRRPLFIVNKKYSRSADDTTLKVEEFPSI